MKLLRYGPHGYEKPGLRHVDGTIRDLSGVISDIDPSTLRPDVLAGIRALDHDALPVVRPDVRIGPCVSKIGKFVCIGLNYEDHAIESGMPIPSEPVVFGKWTSAVIGPNDDVVIPRGSEKTDWEVELGVVIGKQAAYVNEEAAMEYVAGYCVVNDVSERSYQLERGGSWDKGKGCDTFGPTGPWLVTTDEIKDPHSLNMWLEVDGHRYQSGNTRTMIFKVPRIVAYLSNFMTLQPGDIISTGTPPGVGLGIKPNPVFLRHGQTIRHGIEGLGDQCF